MQIRFSEPVYALRLREDVEVTGTAGYNITTIFTLEAAPTCAPPAVSSPNSGGNYSGGGGGGEVDDVSKGITHVFMGLTAGEGVLTVSMSDSTTTGTAAAARNEAVRDAMGNALTFAGGSRARRSILVYTAGDERAATTVSTAVTATVGATVGVTVGASVVGSAVAAAAAAAAAAGAAGGSGGGSAASSSFSPPGNALVSMIGHVQTFALAGSLAVSNMPPAFAGASGGLEWASFRSKCPPWKPKCAEAKKPTTFEGVKLSDANSTSNANANANALRHHHRRMILQVMDVDGDSLHNTAMNISATVVMDGDTTAAVEAFINAYFVTDPSSTDVFLATIGWCAVVMTCVVVTHFVFLKLWDTFLPDSVLPAILAFPRIEMTMWFIALPAGQSIHAPHIHAPQVYSSCLFYRSTRR